MHWKIHINKSFKITEKINYFNFDHWRFEANEIYNPYKASQYEIVEPSIYITTNEKSSATEGNTKSFQMRSEAMQIKSSLNIMLMHNAHSASHSFIVDSLFIRFYFSSRHFWPVATMGRVISLSLAKWGTHSPSKSIPWDNGGSVSHTTPPRDGVPVVTPFSFLLTSARMTTKRSRRT